MKITINDGLSYIQILWMNLLMFALFSQFQAKTVFIDRNGQKCSIIDRHVFEKIVFKSTNQVRASGFHQNGK